MMYMPRPALRFPRDVEVPSALSIMREDRRYLMLDVSRKRGRSAQHTSGQAPHDHLYVNWFCFCVTAISPVRGLISKRRLDMHCLDARCGLNPVWYMHALK